MHRKIRTAAAAVAATLATGLGVAPHAQAASDGDAAGTAKTDTAKTETAARASSVDHRMYTNDDNPGGRVTFQTYGDVMQVCDVQADGWAARVRVWNASNNDYKYTLRAGGNGTCDTARASYGGRYNLGEGETFQVIVDLVKGSRADFGDVAFWWNQN